jgi:hypothetical protein
LRDPDAAGAELGQHRFVVHEVAEDGQRLGAGSFLREDDGVAHAKAHAQVVCAENLHGFRASGG